MVTITSRDPGAPPIDYIARSGGLFRDMMIHDFDMARFLLGEEPVAVSAMGSALVDKAIGEAGDVDTAVVIMETKSGKVAQISNSHRALHGYDQRIEAHGSKGMIRADNIRETSVEFAGAARFPSATRRSTSPSSATPPPIAPRARHLYRQGGDVGRTSARARASRTACARTSSPTPQNLSWRTKQRVAVD